MAANVSRQTVLDRSDKVLLAAAALLCALAGAGHFGTGTRYCGSSSPEAP